jgi:uroporphyrinogen-III decarboxylase
MKGTMFDMYRVPDKLKAAIDLFTPMSINTGIIQAQLTGSPRVFVPLHRGADPFMSNEQFAEFYWPGLKKLLLALIDAGLTPVPFFEGSYTNRLAFLAELPPGKVLGHMDVVDKKKYKEILGNIMCFWGDVPPGLLIAGTPQEVTDYVKDLIDTFADTGGLIVDGAVEGIPAESKIENVEAMVETVFEYGVY